VDIETTPNLAHVWQLWGQQHIGLNQLMESSELLCAAYKWHGDPRTNFIVGPSYEDIAYQVLPYDIANGRLSDLFNAVELADAVITYNGKKFDIPRLNSAFIENGFDVPAPYQQIDLYQTVKRVFGWPSMKLNYVAGKLLGENKVKHEGHDLWVKCMAGDPEAWARMREYNMQDVVITEKLYDKLLPWIPNHPNVLLYTDDPSGIACTYCGSLSYQRRGPRQLATGIYQQYRCNDCGAWFRLTKRQDGSTVR
jgi:DNA-directed RNA polymerase subunit RPC12/RpoP